MATSPVSDVKSPWWKPSIHKRKRMLYIEAWVLIVASYPVVIFAHALPPEFANQSPAYVWAAWTAFMIRTFEFFPGLIFVCIAIVALIVRKYRLCGAAAPLAIFCAGGAVIDFLPKRPPVISGESVAVMSVNLLMVNPHRQAIVDEIQSNDPDVILLQEYTDAWHAAIYSTFGEDYPFHAFERREDSFGAAIYSKRKFVEPVRLNLPLGRATEPQMRAVIMIDDQPVALYNVHLLPPWGLEYVTETRQQFHDLTTILQREQLPAIVVGDFNFTDNSPQVDQLEAMGYRGGFDLAGWGRGSTWPANSVFRWIPSIRLDHVFLSEKLTASFAKIGTGKGSDHRPVIVELGLK